MLDVYTRDGKSAGIMERMEAHKKGLGLFHKCVMIWIINSSGQVLVGQRAKGKTNELKWETGVGEHVQAGEELLPACVRGVREELGLDTREEDYIFLGGEINDGSQDFRYFYILRSDVAAEDMVLQPEEVAAVRWMSLDEFREFMFGPHFVGHAQEYKEFVYNHLLKQMAK